MNCKMLMTITGLATALCASAVNFPGAGGDISSNGVSGWNGAMPDTSAEAGFTQAGTYTASADVTFGSVNLATGGLVFDFTAANKTVTLGGDTPMAFQSVAADLDFKGGMWKFGGKTVQVRNISSSAEITLSDGCVWTNLNNFTPSYGGTGAKSFRVLDRSRIHADSININNYGNNGIPGKLEIGSGGEVHIVNTTLEINATAGTYGGNRVDVHGTGSLFDIANDCNTSYRTTDDGLRIRDNATLRIGGTTKIGVTASTVNAWMEVLNGATATTKTINFQSSDGRLTVSNATLSATKLAIGASGMYSNRVQVLDGSVANADEFVFQSGSNRIEISDSVYTATKVCNFGWQENFDVHDSVLEACGQNTLLTIPKINIGTSTSGKTDRNQLIVRDLATADIRETFFISSNNRLSVSDATYYATNGFQLGYTSAATGNVATVSGSSARFVRAGNVFGSGRYNTFELGDRAIWDIGGVNVTLMGSTDHNTLRVTGGAVLRNVCETPGDQNFYIGSDNDTHGDNTMEILDGATVSVERFFVRGVNNRIIVSNATLNASSTAGYGIWIGHGSNSAGNKLIIRGTTPRVALNEYKSAKGSSIRFEVPAAGYANGYVPVTARILNPGSTTTEKFEIDCTAWAANHEATGSLVLMRTEDAISNANAAWILAQNPDLPANVKLKVKGGDVILCKPNGLTVVFR